MQTQASKTQVRRRTSARRPARIWRVFHARKRKGAAAAAVGIGLGLGFARPIATRAIRERRCQWQLHSLCALGRRALGRRKGSKGSRRPNASGAHNVAAAAAASSVFRSRRSRTRTRLRPLRSETQPQLTCCERQQKQSKPHATQLGLRLGARIGRLGVTI